MATASSSPAPLIILAEIDAYRAGNPSAGEELGWGATPFLTLTRVAQATEAFDIIRASDLAYRSEEGSTGGLRVYPPILETSVTVDNQMALSPLRTGLGAAWGTLALRSIDGALQSLAEQSTADGRGVRLYAARRNWDTTRKIWTDPLWSDFSPLVIGIAGGGWVLADQTLQVPLRDGSYHFERPMASNTYLGTGGIEGGVDLKGKNKPKLRGGTLANPVRNIRPVLVDATNLVYQISDTAFSVAGIFEGGDTGIGVSTATSNLYSGTCPAGTYRLGTGTHAGLMQLGSKPIRDITLDCYNGFFPTSGTPPATLALQVYRFLLEDLQIPAEFVDIAHWNALAAACDYGGGFWLDTEAVRGDDVVSMLLAGLYAKLVPTRDGKLRPILLRALKQQTPVASYGIGEIVDVTPVSLKAPLDPPPLQWRVGYARNYLVQDASGLDPDVVGTARQTTLGEQWRVATSTVNAAVAGQYRRPSEPEIIETALTSATDAAALATALDACWSTQRRNLYRIELPSHLALGRNIGDVVSVQWPYGLLANGVLAQIVGESYTGGSATSTLLVLTASNATLLPG